MERKDFEVRIKRFAVGVIRSTDGLVRSRANEVITKQIIRSACSIGANYREAGRAESRNDFVHKIGTASKEACETEYWLELLLQLNESNAVLNNLLQENHEIARILISSGRTARERSSSRKPPRTDSPSPDER